MIRFGEALGRIRKDWGEGRSATFDGDLRRLGGALGAASRATRREAGSALAGSVRLAAAARHQLESGRQARASRLSDRPLRDLNGRRLRASAFNPKRSRAPGTGGGGPRRAATALLPAAVKILLIVVIAAGGFLGSSQAYINYAADLPDAHALAAQPDPQDTLIWNADGTVVLADLHPGGYQHFYEPLDTTGKNLPAATIAIEDANFYNENGIDPTAMARAAWIDWREHRTAQGASTITQQLVKLRLLGSAPTLDRKVKEAILALQVERTYSKRQILEMYLNTVFYGNSAYGTRIAAWNYFHVSTKDLDLAQASMLAGIPQSPLYNNPLTNWTHAKLRQREVLDAMVRNHMATAEDADRAYAEDIRPPAHMFVAETNVTAPAFVSYVTDVLRAKYGDKTVYGGGLNVYTTINTQLEEIAQRAVTDQVNAQRWRGLTQGALVSIDPHTGAIVAMVGSADPHANGGQYNMAVWPPRNPGSSMKIYNYTAAIASGKYTMVTPISDSPLKIKAPGSTDTYEPKNYDLKYHGTCQLQQCMGNSLNVPAVKVEIGVGVPAVATMARSMGAPPWSFHNDTNKWSNDDPLDYYGFSLTLGGYGETPLQMATGASVLGSQGVLHQPYAINRINTADGTEIFKAPDAAGNSKQAVDPKVAYIMEQIMSDDSNRAMIFGPGSPLTLPGRRVAAKTGTTDDFADAWTVGYTPDLATAVWMGNPNWLQKMVTGSDGVFVAAPAWHTFMQQSLDSLGKGDVWYSEPPGLTHATVNGKIVYLLPGTSPRTPAPQLPSWAGGSTYSGGGSSSSNGGNGNGNGHGGDHKPD